MGEIRLTILVHEQWRDRYADVVEACRHVGLMVENELVSIGVIVGCIDEARVPVLTSVQGVCAVEPERLQTGFEQAGGTSSFKPD